MAALLPVPSWHQRHTPHTRDAGIFAHRTKDSIIKNKSRQKRPNGQGLATDLQVPKPETPKRRGGREGGLTSKGAQETQRDHTTLLPFSATTSGSRDQCLSAVTGTSVERH